MLVVLLLVGLALIAYAVLGSTSDEERIRDQLAALERVARIEPEANLATRSLRLRGELGELFERDVKVELAETGYTADQRDELIALAAQADAAVDSLEVRFGDVEVTLDASGGSARVSATARVDAIRPGQAPERGERAVRFEFVQSAEGWRISRVHVAEPTAPE